MEERLHLPSTGADTDAVAPAFETVQATPEVGRAPLQVRAGTRLNEALAQEAKLRVARKKIRKVRNRQVQRFDALAEAVRR